MSRRSQLIEEMSGWVSPEEIEKARQKREHWQTVGRYRSFACSVKWTDAVFACIWCGKSFFSLSEVHECMRLPTKDDRSKAQSPSQGSLERGQMLSTFSCVWEYLTTTVLPGGKARKMPRLSIKLDGSTLRLTVNEEEACLYATWQGKSMDDLFLMFEEALSTDTVPWKPSSSGGGKR